MATYRLTSHISPIRPKGSRVTISAVAMATKQDQLRIDLIAAATDAESQRAALVAALEDRLRRSGHQVSL